MRIFILEDDHERIKTFRRKLIGHEVFVAESADEAMDVLNETVIFDLIFLDHDLGGQQMMSTKDHNTGTTVARWMIDNLCYRCTVIVHSLNTPAAIGMQEDLRRTNFDCHRIPFTKLVHDLDEPNFLQR